MIALVAGGTLNSSAANLSTAVKGVVSGTLNLQAIVTRIRSVLGQEHLTNLHFKGELRVGSQSDLKSHLRGTGRKITLLHTLYECSIKHLTPWLE